MGSIQGNVNNIMWGSAKGEGSTLHDGTVATDFTSFLRMAEMSLLAVLMRVLGAASLFLFSLLCCYF